MRLTRALKHHTRWLSFIRVRIPAGPLRGRLWLPASRGKLLRHYTGTYEPELTGLLLDHLRPGSVLFDVGANCGYYTLLASSLVGDLGRVVAFEPAPDIAYFLHKHVAINRLENVTVIEAAAGDREGVIRFDSQRGSGRGRASENGDIEVPLRRIDDVATELDVWPTQIKIDVEGFGYEVLCGAREVIRRSRPLIFLSTHGSERSKCTRFFAEAGYRVSTKEPGDLICRPVEGQPAR
jgi:FkbM family methyltransferase